MNVTEIIGKEVLDKHANRMGKVVDIDVDILHGTVNHLVVKMGITKKVNVPVPNIEKAGDRVVLTISKEELEKGPVPVNK